MATRKPSHPVTRQTHYELGNAGTECAKHWEGRRSALSWTCWVCVCASSGADSLIRPGLPAANQQRPGARAGVPELAVGVPAATPDQASLPPIFLAAGCNGVVNERNIHLLPPASPSLAQNTLTGKEIHHQPPTLPVRGAMTLPQNGRYVHRTQFAASTPRRRKRLLNAASHDSLVNFSCCWLCARRTGTGAGEGRGRAGFAG